MYLKSMKDDSLIKINNVTKQYDNVFAVKSLTLELLGKKNLFQKRFTLLFQGCLKINLT